MLLGQLYYFNKVLDSVQWPLTPSSVSSLELCGLPRQTAEDYQGLSSADLARKLRDRFAAAYDLVLEQEALTFASAFWGLLTSPVVDKSELPEPRTEFQSQLSTWQQNEFAISLLPGLLPAGYLSTQEEDFALYYGLRVLFILSEATNVTIHKRKVQTPELKQVAEVADKPEILVLTKDYLAPLFINLNCRYVPLCETIKETWQRIQVILEQETGIKLILIDSEDLALAQYLEKHLPGHVLVSLVSFQSYTQGAFFDQIVRQTLGVKLT